MRTATSRRSAALGGVALTIALLATGCGSGGSGGGYAVSPGPNGAPAPLPAATPTGMAPPEPTARASLFTDPASDPLSTFALDVDTGSYTRFRDAVNHGRSIPAAEVRTEEFVNYFEQDYPAPVDGLDVRLDAAALPFAPDTRLVRVGIRSADVTSATRPDADLALVVDCSGSMGDDGKMETTKHALRTLVGSLRPSDRVGIVCYSDDAFRLLDPTPLSERGRVLDAIGELEPDSSTNAEAGLELGYDMAARMRTEGRITRVILISDGVANVGDTSPGGILERIGTQAREGIHLISVGVGIDTYNDRLLEQLADQGDGWHVYVDSEQEADRVFATRLTESLVITARNAKAQVEFDPEIVGGLPAHRLREPRRRRPRLPQRRRRRRRGLRRPRLHRVVRGAAA